MILDRKISPDFKEIAAVSLIKPEHKVLANGLDLFYIASGEAELVRVEIIFHIDSWNVSQPLDALATFKLMDDGTDKKSSADIAGEIDFYGSFFQVSIQPDIATITLYSLRKYLEKSLMVIHEMLTNAIFPQHELDTFIQNNIQRLQVDHQKTSYLVNKRFYQSIFGNTNKYGYNETEDDLRNMSRAQLLSHYATYISNENAFILVSGKVGVADLDIIEKILGKEDWRTGKLPPVAEIIMHPETNKTQFISKSDAVQSSIRIGKTIIGKTHPDYPSLQVLNTILGGYFGSRLMANIREDKGYTYGIHSVLASQKTQGFFFIGTDVGAEVCQATVAEVFKEIKKLRDEPIEAEELNLVRNYLLGSFQSSIENAFSYAEKFKSVYLYKMDYDYYDRYFDAVNTTTSIRLQQLANQYLDQESMYTVIAGKQ